MEAIGYKRLARKITADKAPDLPQDDLDPAKSPVQEPKSSSSIVVSDLILIPYTARSVVVTGNTLSHTKALTQLGGTFNPNLKNLGGGWVFAKAREESIQAYITTGEINPYIYPKKEFEPKRDNQQSQLAETQLRRIFRELRSAFNLKEDYEGSAIHDVFYQIEEKHLSKS
jgi:hypothetical protein